MEDRTARALDAEWHKRAESPEADRGMFYLGAAVTQRLVHDCFKRAMANRRDGESEQEVDQALIKDITACLSDIKNCVYCVMTDMHADLVKRAALRPDDAEAARPASEEAGPRQSSATAATEKPRRRGR